jgi:hypothetical protein
MHERDAHANATRQRCQRQYAKAQPLPFPVESRGEARYTRRDFGASGLRDERPPPTVPGATLAMSLCRLGRRHGHCGKRLIEISEDVVDMFDADGQPHVAGRHTAGQLIGGA